ncbi:MAG: alkaline phosphatase family protein [Candidatus Eisenbacteria bacterium]
MHLGHRHVGLAGLCILGLEAGLLAPSVRANEPPPIPTHSVPSLDHVIVVVMENHSYDDVRVLPYTASLIAGNSSFSNSFALNPSQPNYIAMWAGATFGVSNDNCPAPGSPYPYETWAACEAAGVTWRAYSRISRRQDRRCAPPAAASTCGTTLNQLLQRGSLERAAYTDLATDIAGDPAPCLLIPNQCNNTHDCPLAVGDNWLAANLPAMIDAVGPNGVVILTWDEDDNSSSNHILTVFAGPTVLPGYVATRTVNHYTVLRTICDALGLAPFGGAASQAPIIDVWNVPVAVEHVALAVTDLRPNPTHGAFEAQLAIPPGSRSTRRSSTPAAGRSARSR